MSVVDSRASCKPTTTNSGGIEDAIGMIHQRLEGMLDSVRSAATSAASFDSVERSLRSQVLQLGKQLPAIHTGLLSVAVAVTPCTLRSWQPSRSPTSSRRLLRQLLQKLWSLDEQLYGCHQSSIGRTRHQLSNFMRRAIVDEVFRSYTSDVTSL